MLQNTENKNQMPSAESLHRLVNNVSEILYIARMQDVVSMQFVSSKACEVTGYSCDELTSDDPGWAELVCEADAGRYGQAFKEACETGKAFQIEYKITIKDGSVREVRDKAQPVFDDKGQVTEIDGLIIDVTEQNRLQRELDRTQMIQNLGRLAAGIAHEINTPIQYIGDNIRFFSDSFGQVAELLDHYSRLSEAAVNGKMDDELLGKISSVQERNDIEFLVEEVPQAIEQTLDGINHVAKLVSAMRDFSHIDERRKMASDLNKAIENSIVISHNELKYVADVEKELDASIPSVCCCVDDINQVLLNLLINSAHSIEGKLASSDAKRGLVTVKSWAEGADVLISVTDTGSGIEQKLQERIFDPFFTTKEAGKGTGQGLAFVRSVIVEKHGGKVELQSEKGVGTTFTIRLPIEQESGDDREQQ
ncbi:MAG: PAS domain-containing protein [Planctomycetes bacterium]|nr:PAS domain-containing protein [Planctomycetota bacterium]